MKGGELLIEDVSEVDWKPYDQKGFSRKMWRRFVDHYLIIPRLKSHLVLFIPIIE